MHAKLQSHRVILQNIAHRAMLELGLFPDFSRQALAEIEQLQAAPITENRSAQDTSEIRDLRNLLWASIDNDDSRDLDQLTTAEAVRKGR